MKTMVSKVDLKKDLKHLYNPSAKAISVVEVPAMNFLMVDGTGDPNTVQRYKDAVEALYAMSYALKFAAKKEQGIDYIVMPLEGQWWVDNMAEFSLDRRDKWQWTMMIMQPDFITRDLFAAAVDGVRKKKHLPVLPELRFERFEEGMAVQILYFGAYKDEGPTVASLRQFIADNGYAEAGKHHEIYLGDPRRTAPEKLKTVIRHPMRRP
jgi:hypothetical protein